MSKNNNWPLRSNLLVDTSSEEETEEGTGAAVEESKQEQGVPIATKKKLLSALEPKGGVDAVSCSSRLLQSICDKDPVTFGSPVKSKTPRGRRKKVCNFVDKFKRLKPEQKAQHKAQIFASKDSPAPVIISPQPTSIATTSPSEKEVKKPSSKMPSPYRNKKSSAANSDDDGT
jgi:hypothetical protein